MLLDNPLSITKKVPSSLIFALLIFIPGVYALYLAINSGEISRQDYWGIMGGYLTIDGFSHHPADWLQPQNGHPILIPKLIYALNVIFTQGSNISLSLIAWFLALLQAFLLVKLLPPTIQNRRIIAVLIFSISAFSFTPSADNWTLGFSGVHWIGANVFAIASIACLTTYCRQENVMWVFGSLVFATAATFTYGTAFVLWPVLCVGAFLILPRWWVIVSYVGGMIFIYINYVPGNEPQLDILMSFSERTNLLILYTLTYLGAIFTTNNIGAPLIGFIGLLLGVIIIGHLFLHNTKKLRLDLFPWLLLLAYTVGNAALTALSRSHMGIEQAMRSRYTSITCLFWIGLIVIVIYYLGTIGAKWSSYKFVPTFVVLGILIVAMYGLGAERQKDFRHILRLQQPTMLSVNLGIPDEVAVVHSITQVPGQFFTMIPTLQAHNHIPFHKKSNSCGLVDQPISQEFLIQTPQNKVRGNFDFLDRFKKYGARAVGWAYSEERDIECIALLNEDNIIRGFAFPGFYRPDIAETLPLADSQTGWMGYARASSSNEELTAYVLLAGDEHWVALAGQHSLEDPGPVNGAVYTAMVLPPP